jgi:NAD(P)H-nitrite reductase large subunit
MVDRCVCFNKTFKELKITAGLHGCTTIPELKKYVIFSENCKLCVPYIEKMLETGETEFPVFS